MAIEIREARPDEYEEAGRITADAYREFARPGRRAAGTSTSCGIADVAERAQRTTILVAVDEDGGILGTVTLELEGRTDEGRESNGRSEPLEPGQAHVRMLGVAPDARGRGVGRLLMDAVHRRVEAGRQDAAHAEHDRAHEGRPGDVRVHGVPPHRRTGVPRRVRPAAYELPLDGDARTGLSGSYSGRFDTWMAIVPPPPHLSRMAICPLVDSVGRLRS